MFFYILCPQNCDFLIKILRDNQEIIKKNTKKLHFCCRFCEKFVYLQAKYQSGLLL